MKLTGKLEGAEQALLTKSVKTIVDQVDAMKRLVNEFRDYARLPAAELKPVDLNVLIDDVMQLYASDHADQTVRTELDAAAPLSWAMLSNYARSFITLCKMHRMHKRV